MPNPKIKTKKVIVAMSGGIDSSVAVALLKRAGFDPHTKRVHTSYFGAKGTSARYGVGVDVIGVFMKFWSAPHHFETENDKYNFSRKKGDVSFSKEEVLQSGGGWNRCCTPEAEARARKVAKILDIPFYVFNFEKEFKKRIVDYFLGGYKAGQTPNPCVVCNKEIKFGLLLEKALALGADFVATGHYAQTNFSQAVLKRNAAAYKVRRLKEIKLLRGKDRVKDQSYFLWQLNQKQLRRILFPIGDYTRAEVESLAKKFKLSFLLNIPKSMEICFVKTTINDFLKRYLKPKPGSICARWNLAQKVVGRHKGLPFYTIGQRKGIGLPGGPYYVLNKDIKKNLLIVTRNEKDLYKKELIAKNVNWISGKTPKLPLKIKVKIRYKHEPALATIAKNLKPKTYTLKFGMPQRAITPGQSVVFYRQEELLGGGIIY